MYGVKRNTRSRLVQSASAGDKQITVATGLDWKAGDQIGIAPTRIKYEEKDFAVITAYDSKTGIAKLDRVLSYQHFGAADSTGAKYSGVDLRAEVMLLSRNVRIVGDPADGWGCQFVTSDFIEGNLEARYGSTNLDNVEIYNCS